MYFCGVNDATLFVMTKNLLLYDMQRNWEDIGRSDRYGTNCCDI